MNERQRKKALKFGFDYSGTSSGLFSVQGGPQTLPRALGKHPALGVDYGAMEVRIMAFYPGVDGIGADVTIVDDEPRESTSYPISEDAATSEPETEKEKGK